MQRVRRGAESEKGGLLRLLLVRRCEVSIRATERWMLSSTSTAGFTVCGLRLAHCRWRDVFAFHTAFPQKRITAEVELIDKRNVQTYVDKAVVRPPIPSGAQSPLLKPLGISFSPNCAPLRNDALMRSIVDAARQPRDCGRGFEGFVVDLCR